MAQSHCAGPPNEIAAAAYVTVFPVTNYHNHANKRSMTDRPQQPSRSTSRRSLLAGVPRLLEIAIGVVVAVYFVLGCLMLGTRYWVLPHIDDYRPRIERIASRALGVSVGIQHIDAQWHGLHPYLSLRGVTLRAPDAGTPGLSLDRVDAVFSWSSLTHLEPRFVNLTLDGPDVSVERDATGQWRVAGIALGRQDNGPSPTLDWLLRQSMVIVRHGTLRWRDAASGQPELRLNDVRFLLVNRGNRHRAGLQAAPPASLSEPLDLRLDFRHSLLAAPGDARHWRGTLYANIGSTDLVRLAAYAPGNGAAAPAAPAVASPASASAPVNTSTTTPDGILGPIQNLMSGHAAARAWVDFNGGQITTATTQVAMRAVQTRLRGAAAPLDIDAASFQANLQMLHPGVSWQIRDLRLVQAGRTPLSAHTFDGRYVPPSGRGGEQAALSGDRLDLGLLASLAPALPLPEDLRAPLSAWQPRGTLLDYALTLRRPASESGRWRLPGLQQAAPHLTYTVRARFDGLGINSRPAEPSTTPQGHPRPGIPGFDGLSGSVRADQDGGRLTLDTQNGTLDLPGVFDEPRMAFQNINAAASWRIADAAPAKPAVSPAPSPSSGTAATVPRTPRLPHITLRIDRLQLANADLAANVSGTYEIGGHNDGHSGTADLQGGIARADAAAVVRYLPSEMGPHVRHYLKYALLAGAAHDVTFRLKGRLEDFPFDQHPGIFNVDMPVNGVRFDPAPVQTAEHPNAQPWPPFEQASGTLHFAQGDLRFTFDTARIGGLTFKQISGKINAMTHPQARLTVSGTAGGPMQDFVSYINATPIAHWIGNFTGDTRASGNGQLTLKLDMPLEHTVNTQVSGQLAFQRNDVVLIKHLPPLQGVTGKLDFTEHGLQLDSLRGRFLGGRIQAEGGSQPGGAVQIRVNGALQAQALRENVGDPALVRLASFIDGATTYTATVTAHHGPPEIIVQSNLAGLALNLPTPLSKAASATLPARFALRPLAGATSATGAGAADALDVSIGPVQAHYVRRAGANGMLPAVRGSIGVNQPPPALGDNVQAGITLDDLDLDAWHAVAAKLEGSDAVQDAADSNTSSSVTAPSDDPLTPYLPTHVILHAKQVRVMSRLWPAVALDASRQSDGWHFNVASQFLAGSALWRDPALSPPSGELRAHLDKLTIPAEQQGKDVLKQVLEQPTDAFPAIDMQVKDFVLHGLALGKLEVAAHNTEQEGVPVWQITKLSLDNPAADMQVTGNWRTSRHRRAPMPGDEPPRRTVLDFKINVRDAGALLERLGLPKTLKNGQGTIDGKLGWRGGPDAIDYPTLNGQLSLDLKNGQVLKADPGLARLLGVLSIQNIARILTLNFNSLLGEGLPFDQVSAHGTLHDGIASTDDFTMTSSAANIEMRGTTNLDKQTQDLRVTVLPHINASSASLAYAFINPALGLGTFVAQIALGHQLSKTLASEYVVTGSWSDPVIRHAGDNQGKMDTGATPSAAP